MTQVQLARLRGQIALTHVDLAGLVGTVTPPSSGPQTHVDIARMVGAITAPPVVLPPSHVDVAAVHGAVGEASFVYVYYQGRLWTATVHPIPAGTVGT